MQGEEHEQKKNLLFLPVHGTILGNAYGVGVSRALNADLIQYWLNGDFIIDINRNTVFFGSPCPMQHQTFIHLPVTSSYMQVSYSDKIAFGYRQVCFLTGQTMQPDQMIH